MIFYFHKISAIMSSSSEDETELRENNIKRLREILLNDYREMLTDPLLGELFNSEAEQRKLIIYLVPYELIIVLVFVAEMSSAYQFLLAKDVSETTLAGLKFIEPKLKGFHNLYINKKLKVS